MYYQRHTKPLAAEGRVDAQMTDTEFPPDRRSEHAFHRSPRSITDGVTAGPRIVKTCRAAASINGMVVTLLQPLPTATTRPFTSATT